MNSAKYNVRVKLILTIVKESLGCRELVEVGKLIHCYEAFRYNSEVEFFKIFN